jgi:ribosomal-protein-serine acetyltransferase
MFTRQVDDHIQLALIHPSFAKSYYRLVSENRAYLSHWLAWPNKADSIEFFQAFIERSLHDYASGKSMVCAIFYKEQIVGNISFNSINNTLKRVEVGYWLAEAYQGKGIVTKALQEMIDIAFDELKLDKVQISTADHNIESRKVCERLGFKLEGIITNAENVNGRLLHHAVYGLHRITAI